MRLIDADAIPYVDLNSDMPQSKIRVYVSFKERIDRLPTIDPVKHGKWIFDDFGFHCSECWTRYPSEITDELNYCPNCGAKMDGGEE